jgi:hypothetical protein
VLWQTRPIRGRSCGPSTTFDDNLQVATSSRFFRHDEIIEPQRDQHIEKHIERDFRGADSELPRVRSILLHFQRSAY